MTYGQGIACAVMGVVIGVLAARRAFSWHVARCCLCSSTLLLDICCHHRGIIDVRRVPCLLNFDEHTGHSHHDEHRPPGPPAGGET